MYVHLNWFDYSLKWTMYYCHLLDGFLLLDELSPCRINTKCTIFVLRGSMTHLYLKERCVILFYSDLHFKNHAYYGAFKGYWQLGYAWQRLNLCHYSITLMLEVTYCVHNLSTLQCIKKKIIPLSLYSYRTVWMHLIK